VTLLIAASAQAGSLSMAMKEQPVCPQGILSDLLSPHAARSQQELHELSIAYGTGHCRPADGIDAEQRLQAAARQNHPVALLLLGLSYDTGNGYPRDAKRANELYERAARLGNTLAQHYLGMNLLRFAKSQDEGRHGLEKLREAAASGYPISAVLLAQIYEAGRYGVAKDLCRARQWYGMAAANGMHSATAEIRRLDQRDHCPQLASSH
jgi:TPR repeat protein